MPVSNRHKLRFIFESKPGKIRKGRTFNISMDYVVIDLEFNNMQGVYHNMKEYLDRENSYKRRLYPNEIIQIGAVRLNGGHTIGEGMDLLIKNTFYKSLNPFISEMTGVTQEAMDRGIFYPDAINQLEEFCRDAVVVTWGVSDIYEIIRNCHMHQTPRIILGNQYLDLQTWVGKKLQGNRTPSLKTVMEEFGVEVDDEKLHDGFYDAQSTAHVLKRVLERYGNVDGLEQSRVLFASDSIFINDISVREIPDAEITTSCPLCEGHIVYDISMNNENGKVRSLYHCEDCQSCFNEDISVKENMLGQRKYFKKIKKVSEDFFRTIIGQRQAKRDKQH